MFSLFIRNDLKMDAGRGGGMMRVFAADDYMLLLLLLMNAVDDG